MDSMRATGIAIRRKVASNPVGIPRIAITRSSPPSLPAREISTPLIPRKTLLSASCSLSVSRSAMAMSNWSHFDTVTGER